MTPIVDLTGSDDLNVPAVLLVGGFGTRLRSILPSTAKPLAPMGSCSFLELLVRQLRNQGIRRLIMCTGYLAGQVEAEFGAGGHLGVSITYSREESPLGTAGALKLASPHIEADTDFLVLNGDSFIEVDFRELLAVHRRKRALATMVVRRVDNAGRYGTVNLDPEGRVNGFVEKAGRDVPGIINGGVYAFQSTILEGLTAPSSLERDVFPGLLDAGVYAFEERGIFIDIGTPDDYKRALELEARLRSAARDPVSAP